MKEIGPTLHKWYQAKKKLKMLEDKIEKYKLEIMKEMNKKGVDKLSGDGYDITRRRNARTYVSKDSLPANLWNEYSTRTHYDSYYLVRQ